MLIEIYISINKTVICLLTVKYAVDMDGKNHYFNS